MRRMKHVVIGTAGHIDHGKSSLVRALTGTDPDRLKEEKERGITIELGFAFLAQEGDLSLAFVDVPGHERFVKNMLAGVGGIDLVLLVVAADESVMPQTREHFEICRLLHIPRGVIALTKTDLADEDLVELAALETRELVAGSFLENAPIVPVSARTGEGVAELERVLVEQAGEVVGRSASGAFRLPADRVFSMKGFGTVVTGTVVAGSVDQEDEVEILPRGLRARVRGLQVHGQTRDTASAGQRTAVNLHGVDVEELERGDVLAAPGAFQATHMLDAELEVLPSSPVPIKDLTRVHLHLGTSQVLSRARVLGERAALAPGERGIVQLRLEAPIVAARGDRFILRRYSPLETIAGGIVIDASPPKHAVRSAAVLAALEGLRDATLEEAAAYFVKEAGTSGVEGRALAQRLALDPRELAGVTGALTAVSESPLRFVDGDVIETVRGRLIDEVKAFQKKNPLLGGMPKSELRERVASRAPAQLFEWILAALVESETLRSVRDLVSTADHRIELTDEEIAARDLLVEAYREAGYSPKNLGDVASSARTDPRLLERVQKVLLKNGTLVQIADGMVFHRDVLGELKELVRGSKSTRERIDVAGFKDLAGVTRKHAIPLLEWLDRERVTRRAGNERIIL